MAGDSETVVTSFRTRAVALLLFAIVCLLPALVVAQEVAPQPTTPTDDNRGSSEFVEPSHLHLASCVPASATTFVRFADFSVANRLTKLSGTGGLFPPFTSETRESSSSLSLGDVIRRSLGPDCPVRDEDLVGAEVGMASSGRMDIGGGVWFMRLDSVEIVDSWYPESTHSIEREVGEARFFVTQDGTVVCIRDHVVAIGKRSDDDPLLEKVIGLMAGAEELSLQGTGVFKVLRDQLPHDSAGFVFLGPESALASSSRASITMLPKYRYAAIGIYVRPDGVELSSRAILRHSRVKLPLSQEAIDGVYSLPGTTLWAHATTVDVPRWLEKISSSGGANSAGKYVPLVRGLAESEDENVFSRLGPHVVFVWDQHAAVGEPTPQAALMMECGDPGAALEELKAVISRSIPVLEMIDSGEKGSGPKIEERVYLGKRIFSIHMADYAAKSRFPLVKLLARTAPSIAAMDGWIVVAMSPRHLERMIQARVGLVPTIGKSPSFAGVVPKGLRSDSLMLFQPALASDVAKSWMESFRAGESSLLDSQWWLPPEPTLRQKRRLIGIGMRARTEPGVVVIARIHPDTAADGLLEVGDRVVGVDDSLLSMTEPNASLRERLLSSKREPGPLLRVVRGDSILEIELPINSTPLPMQAPLFEPYGLLDGLSKVGQGFEVGSYTVHPSRGRHYASKLVLRFVDRDHHQPDDSDDDQPGSAESDTISTDTIGP